MKHHVLHIYKNIPPILRSERTVNNSLVKKDNNLNKLQIIRTLPYWGQHNKIHCGTIALNRPKHRQVEMPDAGNINADHFINYKCNSIIYILTLQKSQRGNIKYYNIRGNYFWLLFGSQHIVCNNN